jgi:molybdate transport system substrate-binding protein
MKTRSALSTFSTLFALMVGFAVTLTACTTPPTPPAVPSSPLVVLAAGSLRAALTQVGQDFEAAPGGSKVNFQFGASGLLRDRLQAGESADVFASANMEHPRALADAGRAMPVRAFARNALCGLASPSFDLHGKTLAQRLLDADVKLGTSTPRADPSGDYAFEMFDRIETTGAAAAGSAARLKGKALQLTGGSNSPPPPPDRNVYGVLVSSGQADVFVTYCTNAALARSQFPNLQVLAVPDSINVFASYGLTVIKPSNPTAERFVAHLLSPAGQARLVALGFLSP